MGSLPIIPMGVKMPKRVLIVDDSELQRMILLDALSRFPCTVIGEAEDGEDAVRKSTQLSPDIILLDMEMPGMTGLDALKVIKANTSSVMVFMVTSIDSSAVIDDCLMAGAEDYIRKDRLETLDERLGRFLRD
jgi:DNA-binding NarL/FixJ family response regulator